MGDSLITVISIVLAAVLIFVFPMMAMAERNDDIAQTTVQTAVQEFVNKVSSTGKITQVDYDTMVQKIYATGNTFDTEMEVQVLDANPGRMKDNPNTQKDMPGENNTYSIFQSQIMDEMKSSSSKEVKLKEGDNIIVSVINSNITFSQMFKGVFYGLSGNNSYKIVAHASDVVKCDGI